MEDDNSNSGGGGGLVYEYNHKKGPPVLVQAKDEEKSTAEVDVKPNILPTAAAVVDVEPNILAVLPVRRQPPPPPPLTRGFVPIQAQAHTSTSKAMDNAGQDRERPSSKYFLMRGCFVCKSKEHLVNDNPDCKKAFQIRGHAKKAIKTTIELLEEIEPGKAEEIRVRTNKLKNVNNKIKKFQKDIVIQGMTRERMERMEYWKAELFQLKTTKIIATPAAERVASQN